MATASIVAARAALKRTRRIISSSSSKTTAAAATTTIMASRYQNNMTLSSFVTASNAYTTTTTFTFSSSSSNSRSGLPRNLLHLSQQQQRQRHYYYFPRNNTNHQQQQISSIRRMASTQPLRDDNDNDDKDGDDDNNNNNHKGVASTKTNTKNNDNNTQQQQQQQQQQQPPVISATLSSSSARTDGASDDSSSLSGNMARRRKETFSNKDVQEEESKRWRLGDVPIADILKAKHSNRWVDPVIHHTATLKEAVEIMIDGGLSAAMIVTQGSSSSSSSTSTNSSSGTGSSGGGGSEEKKVVGLVTSRDLLRCIAAGVKEGDSSEELLHRVVGESVMTPISQVIYARPEETVGMCRTIMAKLGIKCLPVLSKEGRVEGLITARDMSQYRFSAKDMGGKKSYLQDVSERVGLGSNTSMADPPAFMSTHLALEQTPLYVNVGVAELPHPYKTHDGVGMNHRDFGPQEFSTDADLSEDAYFVKSVHLPDEKNVDEMREMTYCGVADGVGSWREYGIDPRDFSHALMKECENVLNDASEKANQPRQEGEKPRRGIRPGEVLSQAYNRVIEQKDIIGSCTATVTLFDNIRHQLHFSNLGDSGIIVLRHIDSDIAGALKRNRNIPRTERISDMQAVFVSQQQLHSFNHPFQLGWTGKELEEEEKTSFSSPKNACTTSIHVRRGDVIIMATDGLFDNVDIDEIATVTLEWEQNNGFLRGGDIDARDERWIEGSSLTHRSYESIPSLAEVLVKKARENSLDSSTDSPFAVLAKENDIMWSGGAYEVFRSVCVLL